MTPINNEDVGKPRKSNYRFGGKPTTFTNVPKLRIFVPQRNSDYGKLHYITLYYITHYMSEHQQINCIIFLTGGLPACLQNRFFSICQQLSEFDSIQLQLTDLLVDKIYLWKAVQK